MTPVGASAHPIGTHDKVQSDLDALAAQASVNHTRITLDALRTAYADADSRFLQLGPLSIHYKDSGTGPAIVLLHGSHGSLAGYDRAAALLSKNYRVIRFDMPGMGLSSDADPASPDAIVRTGDEILESLLNHLGVEQAALVGISGGGPIAYHLAARAPKRVRALILINAPSEDMQPPVRTAALDAEMKRSAAIGFRDLKFWQTYLSWLYGDPARLTPATVRRYFDMNRRAGPSHAIKYWRLTRYQEQTQAALSGVTQPVMIIWGTADNALQLSSLYALERALFRVKPSRILIDDAGHYPPFEVPERVSAIIETYLKQTIAPPYGQGE